jgi:glycosyltransferase involved in cell wall biosynthesis
MTIATVTNAAAQGLIEEGPRDKFASVCILSYERKDFLRQCISSLLETADYPFELIVHDDGSRDPEVRAYLGEMLEAGVISTLIANVPGWNEGQGVAVNRMFGMARGDYLVKMDQDMTFKPGWLRECALVLDMNWKAHELSCEGGEPRIGALGLFRYHAEPVRADEMFIADWVTFHEVRDFVGSVVVIPRDAWGIFGPWEERSEAFAEDNTYKLALAASDTHCCALMPEDKATNHGFGVGPSTLVVAPDTVREIRPGPKVIEGAK